VNWSRPAGASARKRKITAHWSTLWILPIAVLAATSCSSGTAQRSPNIVFLLIDTLRADHLGSYGYKRETTPFIDSLAKRGALFEKAIAQSSWTAPSMASIWTSRLPSEVGVHALEQPDGMRNVRSNLVTKMKDDATTLAATLSNAGYTTIAVTANGFTSLQGFSDADVVGGLASDLFRVGLEKLERRSEPNKPTFVYLHLTDVHHPITPPPPYDRMFETLDDRPHENRHYNWAFGNGTRLQTRAFRVFRSHKLALYDGALRFVDDEFRKFVREIEERGFGEDNTIIVVASDHGEEFWERIKFECAELIDPRGMCGVGHGHSMSQQILRVPLILTGPGVPTGRIARQVRNLDIATTLLDLVGVARPAAMRGGNLFSPTLPSLAISEDIAYGYDARAVQDDSHKLVIYERTKSGRTHFLYKKLIAPFYQMPIDDEAIESRLSRALARDGSEATDGKPIELDEKTTESLRALGYID
jgi:arylsulfatase A-like enzyme